MTSLGDAVGPVDRPERWSMLALLGLSVVLSMTTWFSATAILPELTAHWDLSPAQRGWMTNSVQLGFVIGAVGSSFVNLPDIVSLRRLMALAAILAALVNLGLVLAPDAGWAIVARMATGLALAGIYPPAMKLIATWFVRGRGIAMGAIIGALTLGSAFPHLVRGLLGGVDWRIAVVVSSALTLLGAVTIVLKVREGPYPFSRATFDPRQIVAVLRSRSIALANLGYFGHMWELYAMWGWFLAYLRATAGAQAGASEAWVSLLTFLVVASGVVGCLLGGVMSDRLGRTLTTIVMMAMSGSAALAIGFTVAGPLWLFVVVAVVWGITVIGDSAQFSAITTEVSMPHLVGTALAFQLGVGFALTIASLQLVPIIAAAIGWQFAFLVLVPGPALGIVAMLVLRRLPEARMIGLGRR